MSDPVLAWGGVGLIWNGVIRTMVPPLPSNVLEMVIHLLAECR